MKKAFSWTFIGNFTNAFSKWIILIIFINFLTNFETGLYTFAFALTGPFVLFANMRLRTIYIVSKNNNFSEYIFTRILVSMFVIFIIFLVAFIFYDDYLYVIIIVSFIKTIELMSDILYAVLHRENRLDIIGKILLTKSFVITLIVFITTYIYTNIYFSLLAYVISLIVMLVIEYTFIRLYFVRMKIRSKEIKKLLYAGVPLGFVQLITSFTAALPVLFLENTESIEIIAIFSSINYLMVISNMFMSTISQVYLVTVKNKIIEKDYIGLKQIIYKKLFLIGIALAIIGILFSYFLGPIVIEYIYDPTFSQYSEILVILSIAIFFNFISWIADLVLMAMEYYRIQPIISIIVFLFGLVITYFLVTNYSIIGAAYSLLSINILQSLLKYIFSHIIIYKEERNYKKG